MKLHTPILVVTAITLAAVGVDAQVAGAPDVGGSPQLPDSTQPPPVVDAATSRPAHHATVALVPGVKTIVPGRPFEVAVVFTMEPTWHTYWRDPGDSGMAPSVKWSLPAGYTAGPLRYPTPEVLTGPAGTNYVFHDRVALLVEITPDAAAKPGDAVTLDADVRWLECDADVCLPGRGQATASVTVSGTAEPNQPGEFDRWRALVREGESFKPKPGT